MRIIRISNILTLSLAAFSCIGSFALQTPRIEFPKVKVLVDRVERVSSNEADFSLKIVNASTGPVFLEAYPLLKRNTEKTRIFEGLYLEQWREREGWIIVVPCRDLFVSDAIKLEPDEAMTQERVLKLPLSAVCKERNIHFEGKFRFRVDYFESGNAVETYIEQMSSLGHEPEPPAFAVSEPFEIPSPKK